MQVLYDGLADSKYRPCPLLVKYVEAGWLGRKTAARLLRLPRREAGADAVESLLPLAREGGPKGRMRGLQNRSGRRSRVIRSASCLPPFVDSLVIARQQHVGNRAALPFARPRVMGIFEQPGLETLLLARTRACPSRRGSTARRRRARRAPRSRRRKARSRRSKPRSARGRRRRARRRPRNAGRRRRGPAPPPIRARAPA